MNTDYNKQAIDFLNATSTSFEAKFKTHDFYFADDKEQRDIFRVTLKNKLHTYRFNFGQSISNRLWGTEGADAGCRVKPRVNVWYERRRRANGAGCAGKR